jgi:hypothetical protein
VPLPLIRGREAGSINEVYVAQALDRLKFDYMYQVAIGNPQVRGAVIIDFVVMAPFPQPLEVYGNYWHTGQLGSDDKLKLAIEEQKYGRETIIVWGDETDTPEKALAAVKRELV